MYAWVCVRIYTVQVLTLGLRGQKSMSDPSELSLQSVKGLQACYVCCVPNVGPYDYTLKSFNLSHLSNAE